MACLSNYSIKGITFDCTPNIAGISDIWIGYFEDYTFTPEQNSDSGNVISAVTKANSAATLQHYSFAKQTGSLTSTMTKDEANGTRYYTNSIALQFNKMEAWKHLEIEALGAERLVCVVKDLNGNLWAVGVDSYVSADETVAQSGQSFDDLNGYTLTLNQMSAHLPFKMTDAQLTSITE